MKSGEPGKTPSDQNTAASSRPRDLFIMGSMAVGVVGLFLTIIVGRFIPIHEGWLCEYGRLMNLGLMPYRDFHFFTQPIHLLLAQALGRLGEEMIYFRYYGLVEKLILTASMFYLYSRYFSGAASFWASVASVIFATSFSTDSFFIYTNTCLGFFVLALICLQAAYRFSKYRLIWMALCGSLVALAFFTKQSSGLFASLSVVLAVVILGWTFRQTVTDLACVSAGWGAIAIAILGWLRANGALDVYFHQVFLDAAKSKGSLAVILFGFFARLIHPWALPLCAVLFATLLVLRWRGRLGINAEVLLAPRERPRWMLAGIACGAIIVALVFHALWPIGLMRRFMAAVVATAVIHTTCYIVFGALGWLLLKRVRTGAGSLANQETPIILLVAGMCWIYAQGTSFEIREPGVTLSLGLIVAFCYDRLRLGLRGDARRAITCVAALLIYFGAWHKSAVAFEWMGWRESVNFETATSRWPALKGFHSASIGEFYDPVVADIKSHYQPGDSLFTFPFMPMFNYVTKLAQPTFAVVHYWDVCPDAVATADAARIRALRPRFIVTMEADERQFRFHEEVFREGRRSGQRDIAEAIDELTKSGDYKLLRSKLSNSDPRTPYCFKLWWREKR